MCIIQLQGHVAIVLANTFTPTTRRAHGSLHARLLLRQFLGHKLGLIVDLLTARAVTHAEVRLVSTAAGSIPPPWANLAVHLH